MKIAVFGNGSSLLRTIPRPGEFNVIGVCNGAWRLAWLYKEIKFVGFCDIKAHEEFEMCRFYSLSYYEFKGICYVNFFNQPVFENNTIALGNASKFKLHGPQSTGAHMLHQLLHDYPNEHIHAFGFDETPCDLHNDFKHNQVQNFQNEFAWLGLSNHPRITWHR